MKCLERETLGFSLTRLLQTNQSPSCFRESTISNISFSVSSSFFSVEEIFLHIALTDISIAFTFWSRQDVILLITSSLILAIRASAPLAYAMLGCFGVILFSIVWRILVLIRDNDHKSDRDMLRSFVLHLVCGFTECIQLSRFTATVHLKADHVTSNLTVSVYLMYICYWLGWVYFAR